MNVLVSSAGRRVSLVRIAGEAARLRDPAARVLATDAVPHLSAACQVADDRFSVPRVTDKRFLDSLHDIAVTEQVGLIIPTLDTELGLLASVRDAWAAEGIHIAVSDLDLVKVLRDKRTAAEFFVAHGFAVPELLSDNTTFPRFIKPVAGSLSADIHVCQRPEEVHQAWWDRDCYVHQEAIDPRAYSEFTVDMYCDRAGRTRCAVARRRVEVRGGEVSKGRTEHGVLEQAIFDQFATISGARGCLTAQFFVPNSCTDPTQILGIEVNARFGGGYPLSDRAGAHYVQWLLSEYLDGQSPVTMRDWVDGLTMLRFDDAVFIP